MPTRNARTAESPCASPTLSTLIDLAMRLVRPASTLPGPSSSAWVTPSPAMRSTVFTHCTAPSTWRTNSSGTRAASVLGSASTLAITGNASAPTVTPPRACASRSRAGRMRAQ
jgi:hypothetical protein